jgi:hypothetical protein
MAMRRNPGQEGGGRVGLYAGFRSRGDRSSVACLKVVWGLTPRRASSCLAFDARVPSADRHNTRMNARRVVLIVTCLAVAGLAGWFGVARWERADRVATVLSGLGAVAAVGVAIWAALAAKGDTRSVRVSNTGPATAGPSGTATSGLTARAANLPGRLEVDHTGRADSSRGGDATTGVGLT